jgi:hypothetical protein
MLTDFIAYLEEELRAENFNRSFISSPNVTANVWRIEQINRTSVLGLSEETPVEETVTIRFLLVNTPLEEYDRLRSVLRGIILKGRYIQSIGNGSATFVPEVSIDMLIVDFSFSIIYSEVV